MSEYQFTGTHNTYLIPLLIFEHSATVGVIRNRSGPRRTSYHGPDGPPINGQGPDGYLENGRTEF